MAMESIAPFAAAPHYLGHNPLGSAMIMMLLAAALAQATTGLFTTDDIAVEGPLASVASAGWSSAASRYHGFGFLVILGLSAIHFVANLVYTFVKKDNLIGAMVTGSKAKADFADQPEAKGGSIGLAFGLLVAAAAIVFGSIWLSGGKF
jgi:cytochrome b